MRDGYSSVPAGYARRLLDDKKLIAFLHDMPATSILPDGRVVPRPRESHWWLVDTHTFYGNLSLRHELTAETEKVSGHIGYSVHPHHQGKGIGTRLMEFGLEQARLLGLPRLLVTIDADNLASIRIAEKAGAILQDVIDHPQKPGTAHNRYWITL